MCIRYFTGTMSKSMSSLFKTESINSLMKVIQCEDTLNKVLDEFIESNLTISEADMEERYKIWCV